MDILYSIDNRYIDIMLASFVSLYENSNLPYIRLHIICENFSQENYYYLENFLSKYNVSYKLYHLNSDLFSSDIPKWKDTNIANARLFLERIIDLQDIDHLLYLDADTIIKDSLDSLHAFDDETVSLVKDEVSKYYYKKLGLDKYYNSGVIYFNIKKWVDDGIENNIMETIKKGYKLEYPDQDILNIALKDIISELPLSYNMNPTLYSFSDIGLRIYFNKLFRAIDLQEVKNAKENPKILHTYGFGNIKPWNIQNVNQFSSIFMNYIEKVNPEFTKTELTNIRKILSMNKHLFNMYLIYAGCNQHIIKSTLKKALKNKRPF